MWFKLHHKYCDIITISSYLPLSCKEIIDDEVGILQKRPIKDNNMADNYKNFM